VKQINKLAKQEALLFGVLKAILVDSFPEVIESAVSKVHFAKRADSHGIVHKVIETEIIQELQITAAFHVLDVLQGQQDIYWEIWPARSAIKDSERFLINIAEHVLIKYGSPRLAELFSDFRVHPLSAVKKALLDVVAICPEHFVATLYI
jgi:hypothetical protein